MHNSKFIFLSGTKMNVASVVDKFKTCNLGFSCGVEPVGTGGFGWSHFSITCVFS